MRSRRKVKKSNLSFSRGSLSRDNYAIYVYNFNIQAIYNIICIIMWLNIRYCIWIIYLNICVYIYVFVFHRYLPGLHLNFTPQNSGVQNATFLRISTLVNFLMSPLGRTLRENSVSDSLCTFSLWAKLGLLHFSLLWPPLLA